MKFNRITVLTCVFLSTLLTVSTSSAARYYASVNIVDRDDLSYSFSVNALYNNIGLFQKKSLNIGNYKKIKFIKKKNQLVHLDMERDRTSKGNAKLLVMSFE